MATYRHKIRTKQEETKTYSDFSEKETQILFEFLERHSDDEKALYFVKRWFNCTMHTIVFLMFQKNNK